MLRFIYPGFSKKEAYSLVKKGLLVPIARGVYYENDPPSFPTSEPDRAELSPYALALLAYRYPDTILIGESARRVSKGLSPMNDEGQVFIYNSGVTSRRTRPLAPGIDAVLFPTPKGYQVPTGKMVEISPGIHFPVRIPGRIQIIRDAIHCPEAAPAPADLLQLLDGLGAAERSYLEASEPMLPAVEAGWRVRAVPSGMTPLAALEQFPMLLQDVKVGNIVYDGVAWRLKEALNGLPTGILPTHTEDAGETFLDSLLPEAKDENYFTNHDPVRNFFKEPRRVMSFTMGNVAPIFHTIPPGGDLARHQKDGIFTGVLLQNIFDVDAIESAVQNDPLMPRISGMQVKVPGYLNSHGQLRLSDGFTPFTLLVKPDPQKINHLLAGMSVLEWAGQNACRAAGIDTPEYALVVSKDGLSTALLSERFDIPKEGRTDVYGYALDGMAVMGLHSQRKYSVTFRQLWQACLRMGVDSQVDAWRFFERTVAAWAMGDTDFHGKNLSILRECPKGGRRWVTRIAPGYDTVPVVGLPKLAHKRMALPIEGHTDEFSRGIWRDWGSYLGLPGDDAVKRAVDIAQKVQESLAVTAQRGIPGLVGEYHERVQDILDRAARVSAQRVQAMLEMRADPAPDSLESTYVEEGNGGGLVLS